MGEASAGSTCRTEEYNRSCIFFNYVSSRRRGPTNLLSRRGSPSKSIARETLIVFKVYNSTLYAQGVGQDVRVGAASAT